MNQEEQETQALQAELAYRQQPIELNPQILQNVFDKAGLKSDKRVDSANFWHQFISPVQSLASFLWQWRIIGMSFATSALMIVVILFQIMPPEPKPRLKSPSMPLVAQQLKAVNPQIMAETLKTKLAKLGIIATVKALDEDEGWMIEVADLSTDDPDALSTLLEQYNLKWPPPGESGLKIWVVVKN